MFDQVLADRVRPLLASQPDVSERRMFGGLAFLVGGSMAVAVSSHGGLMVRVAPDETAELLREPGTSPMEMRGRPMKGWIRVDAGAAQDDDELARWVTLGVARADALA
ncbi:TfoX/Sxy family protein [Cellulomonas sp. PhB150]|uniref:TfoX/Sxy family protein n=1 Tax=Cellulomonas sp. PhB150 TaxID=2485188 RepID=UPI000F4864F2|nr:TfoX/Sxy family protein [Cellulomonas sp. PhB150]ROS23164.1 TfoX/Sxy family transcriptional regulator of competence genes [Cellulomonas sp. PhB150]